MIRWYCIGLWEVLDTMGYTWVMRMDEDSKIHSPITAPDVFASMASENFRYGYRMSSYESGFDDGQFHRFLRRFLLQHEPQHSPTWLLEPCGRNASVATYSWKRCGEMFGLCEWLRRIRARPSLVDLPGPESCLLRLISLSSGPHQGLIRASSETKGCTLPSQIRTGSSQISLSSDRRACSASFDTWTLRARSTPSAVSCGPCNPCDAYDPCDPRDVRDHHLHQAL